MNYDELSFAEFLGGCMKDKGVSIKRLAESTGIAPNHIENMIHGNLEGMPSAPYFRGYVIRIGKVLDFDGEEAWERLKAGGFVKNSGSLDSLPRNRFMKKAPPKFLWAGIAGVLIVIIYLSFELPRVLGKPTLTITSPSENPYTTTSSTLTIMGTVRNADVLYLSNGDASSSEEITIAPDGTWEKMVLLSPTGLNTFQISAKKLLGNETDVIEQVLYEGATVSGTSTTASTTFPTVHSGPTPATGTFFE